jgi:hypothetical protein
VEPQARGRANSARIFPLGGFFDETCPDETRVRMVLPGADNSLLAASATACAKSVSGNHANTGNE